ncbi:hypothetical protein JMJ77_0003457 [Colletotrichum scovillei]|uniref:BZIP domain-containing protein n=1 Tax=Colletotrichum scovillei TaxID=1209932 RepID=A0A9P7U469_9PEZI|nr:hypothetical protein JMJ78_0004967 [Colletotrichum scovillei]KAG7041351.1 hypothetical protein JMJ77_0003457 [Colletotrichum scovillei]KAG7061379.1 hypothetical protein JMJ76_0000943 [Colletotrichum scovillei]
MAETTTLPHISSLVQPAIRTVVSGEDNWKGKTSPAERRKIQNRLNQRTWRQRRKAEKQQQRQAKTRQSGTDERKPSSSSSLSPPSSSAIVASSKWAAALPAASVANDNDTTTYVTVEMSRQGLYKSKTSSQRSAKYTTLMALKYIGRQRQIADIRDEDLDDIYQLFLQHAHESRRSPSPDPLSDSLIPLVQFNLFRGLMENMKTLGITMPMICDDDCVSPFGSDPTYNANTAWNIPYFLKPTETQLTTIHHPWLDFLPLPRMRDNLIKAGDDWDDEALCLDMVGDGDAPSGKGGMILWGEPWDPNSWEVTEDFVEKWRWILEGCEEIIRSSNYWRAKRGEKRMRATIASHLRNCDIDKWGWVIYRTTYGDDEAWERCKEIITYRTRRNIADSDAPEIAKYLELTFVDDKSLFDGASKHQLRSHFRTWSLDAFQSENPRVKDVSGDLGYWMQGCGVPRHVYFFQVDLESLRSIVFEAPQPPDYDLDLESHINFIDAYWKPLRERAEVLQHTDQDEIDASETAYEPIEGCGEENVGWMKVSPETMGSDWYEVWLGSIGGDASMWYAFYKRPPEKVYWASHSHRQFLTIHHLSPAFGGSRCASNDGKGSKPGMDVDRESELLRDEIQDFDKWG